jgi:Tol biopolymer transport system component
MLAYLWPAGGSADLFMLDPVGGDVVQLTHIGGVLEFAVSVDSLHVFFNAENGTGGSGLWRMEMLTRESALVLDCGADLCALPQPSPDGQWLAYENTSQNEIWLWSLTGADPVLLGGGTRPLWSAEGKLAFYEEAAQAFRIMDPAGAVPPASFPNTMGEPGTWSPDGGFFIAPDTDVTANASRLLRFLLINGLITNLSGDELVEDSSPAYSPNGQWLAFARKYLDVDRWTLGRQVWVMDADGENARALTDDEFYAHTSFAWSPDSQTFAFVRAHRTASEVPPEIWMVNVDGSARVQLVIGGYAPQWIP